MYKTFEDCKKCGMFPKLCSAWNIGGEWEHDEGVNPCVVILVQEAMV